MQLIQYKNLFLSDASRLLKNLEDLLLTLEKKRSDAALIDGIMIALHSLKGNASTMSYHELANTIHRTEELFAAVKLAKKKISNQDIDNLFVLLDAFRSDLESIRSSDREIDLGPASAFLMRGESPGDPPGKRPRGGVQEKQGVYEPLSSYVEAPAEELDRTLDMVNDMYADNLRAQRLLMKNDGAGVTLALHALQRKLSDIRQTVVGMKMMPVKQYFAFASRLVRDLARQGRKFVTLEFRDNNLRFERNILESLRDICVQLVKNAVDHGFRQGDKGKVLIEFGIRANRISLVVADTGRGIAWDELAKRAVAQKIVSPQKLARMKPAERQGFLFTAAVSSKEKPTVASGRGVGWSAVQKQVGTLGGALSYESSGRGTRFSIAIPITQTLFRALTWQWGSFRLGLPLSVLENIIQLTGGKQIASKKTYAYRGKPVPIFDLSAVLDPGGASLRGMEPGAVAILALESPASSQSGGTVRLMRLALMLPVGVREQELIVQSVASIAANPLVAGAAITDDSVPVIVLNHRYLFQNYGKA